MTLTIATARAFRGNYLMTKAGTDAMHPTIRCDDDVAIDLTVKRFAIDGIYVFRFKDQPGHCALARVQCWGRGAKIIYDNKFYDGYQIPDGLMQNIEVLGFVRMVGRLV